MSDDNDTGLNKYERGLFDSIGDSKKTGKIKEGGMVGSALKSVAKTSIDFASILVFDVPWFKDDPSAEVEKDDTDLLAEPDFIGHIHGNFHDGKGVFAGEILEQKFKLSTEDRGLIIGPPGTGKTAFLVNQIFSWSKTKKPFICLDMKPEIWGITKKKLESDGYKVLVFNPTSGGHRYNVLSDIDSVEAIGELVANLVESSGAENAVFFETARDLVDAIINHLRSLDLNASLVDVRKFFNSFSSSEKMLGELADSPDFMAREIASELRMVAENDRLFASVIAAMRTGLKFLRYPAINQALSESDFSLKELCSDKPVALFLQFEESKSEMLQRLTAMIVGHIMRYFIDHTERNEILLLLDEIGNAKGVSGLANKLNTIRSRKLPTWMYWQTSTQMNYYSSNAVSGKDLIFAACDFVGVFRLNDNETARYISEKIGTVDRLITTYSTSESTTFSTRAYSDGSTSSISKELREEPVIKPHQLQELPSGTMVCMYRGCAWKGMATPYYRTYKQFSGVKPIEVRPKHQDQEKTPRSDSRGCSELDKLNGLIRGDSHVD